MTTGADSEKNFLVVDNKTETATIESTFDRLIERKDIAIILINQHASYPDVQARWPWLTGPLKTDRGQDTPPSRFLHRCVSHSSGNSEQRSPIRPREGQCVEEGPPFVWRMRSIKIESGLGSHRVQITDGARCEQASGRTLDEPHRERNRIYQKPRQLSAEG